MITYMKCPKCKKERLLFEQIQGIRIIYEDENGKRYFEVKCPRCGRFKLPKTN